MKNKTFFVFAIFFLSLLCSCNSAKKSDHTTWRVYGGGPDNTRYSTLSEINRDNVKQLQVAWTFDTEDGSPGSEMECNPIIVDGTLYATTPRSNVIALDAATGKLRWRFNPWDKQPFQFLYEKVRNRGVTFWSDGDKDRRIFVAARQFLYALNADTGAPIESFGNSGHIDLREDLGREVKNWVTMTTPGIVYKDFLIIGSSMAEVEPDSPGDIRAYDTRSGKLRWTFHTIPHPGEFGYETWPKDAWKYAGAANSWSGLSLDVERGLVFVPLGSAVYDFYGADRPGDNLFASSLVVLKADTGERVWHFQNSRHDIWDRDLPTAPALVTVKHDGKDVDAVAQPTKSGYVLLFDRQTGKPLFPIEDRKVPPSDIPGEVAAETQPFPTLPEPFARQKLTADMITQRTPEAHDEALARFSKVRSDGQFIPPSKEGTIIFPGFDGGGEWGGPAYDPETHMLIVNANEMAWVLRLVEQKPQSGKVTGKSIYLHECATCHKPNMQGAPPEFPSLVDLNKQFEEKDIQQLVTMGGNRMPGFARLGKDAINAVVHFVYTGQDSSANVQESRYFQRFMSDGYNRFFDKDGYPAIQPPWGTLNSINLDTGKIAWKIPLGEYPELVAQGMKDTGSENYGGPVVTSGGLIFIAATTYDNKIRAFDKSNGQLLWEATLPGAGNATPATYEVNGKQYVVIAVGGGKMTRPGSPKPSVAKYVAFALPK
ncbi:MAG TPA: PQQ-binding-like beta-propeller repeat protein [Terriglobales bacterium]|nr:PQQ-binding-like beta-propeller repeat protein [Terriglobales bacterium]